MLLITFICMLSIDMNVVEIFHKSCVLGINQQIANVKLNKYIKHPLELMCRKTTNVIKRDCETTQNIILILWKIIQLRHPEYKTV